MCITEASELVALRKEVEQLKRLRKAERAAEREYLSDTEEEDSDAVSSEEVAPKKKKNVFSVKKQLAKRKAERRKRKGEHLSDVFEEDSDVVKEVEVLPKKHKKVLSVAKRLAKKRKEERRKRKVRSCVLQYVGPVGTIKKRITGRSSLRRVYDIKCPTCSFKSSRLSQHLVSVHKFDEKIAKMKESEIRVMYLWAKKNKHGVPKPLPCDICHIWHLRLDNHLKNKHKMGKDDVKVSLEKARAQYWCTEKTEKTANCVNETYSSELMATKNNVKKTSQAELRTELSSDVSSGVNYIPSGSKKINEENIKQWGIENESFILYYDDSDSLLEAFKNELSKKHPISRCVAYRNHVEHIWKIIDPKMNIFPKSAFANTLLVEDQYHNVTLSHVGKGGNEASTLRVRYVALRLFLKFFRRRHVYGGLNRDDINKLSEYIEEWNLDFTKHIAQRKTDLRKIKLKRLMTPSHMIKYGRSSYVQGIVGRINRQSTDQESGKPTKRFAQQVRDYLIAHTCIMNGLRSSNIIELRVQDVIDATTNADYPGYNVFVNSTYKTSTIYGEKLIALPSNIFKHLQYYMKSLLPILNPSSATYLFISSDSDRMSHGAIGSALTSSFKQANVFTKKEYKRVCPTRIRCSCATFGCKADGIDSGYFAKHFMKNKEATTQIHYNLYSNHREALKLAMMIGDTFQVGGMKKVLAKKEIEDLTKAIYKEERNLPTKEHVINWITSKNTIGQKEMADILEMLEEIDSNGNKSSFYMKQVEKDIDVVSCGFHIYVTQEKTCVRSARLKDTRKRTFDLTHISFT